MRYKLSDPTRQELRLAEEAVKAAAQFLGIPTPGVNFLREANEWESDFGSFRMAEDCVLGFATDRDIFLRRGLADTELVLTAIHEVKHVGQAKSQLWRGRSQEAKERDARTFELAWPRTPGDVSAFNKLYGAGTSRSTQREPRQEYRTNANTKVYDRSDEWQRWNWKLNPAAYEDQEWVRAMKYARQHSWK